MGRPSLYSEELAMDICKRIMSGESLRSICKDEAMPNRQTIFNWLADSDHPFFGQYARARDIQMDLFIDEIIDISDDGSNDFIEVMTKNGVKIMVDHDHIQRSKLRIDTRKWIASKLKPKKYGDKITIDSNQMISSEVEETKILGQIQKDPEQMKLLKALNEVIISHGE